MNREDFHNLPSQEEFLQAEKIQQAAHMPEDKHDWVGAINTISGNPFDIVNPKVDMIRIEDIAHALALQCRYNGHVPSFYSVAEHSVRVSDWLMEQGYPDYAFAGLMHDASEAYIGDIVRPMKQLPEFGGLYKQFEAKIEKVIGERFNVAIYPTDPIVAAADKAVYEWEVEDIRSGNVWGWSWREAMQQFLERFNRYCLHRDLTPGYAGYGETVAYGTLVNDEDYFAVEDLPLGGKLIIDDEVLQIRAEDAILTAACVAEHDSTQPDELSYDAWCLLANGAYWDQTDTVNTEKWLEGRDKWRDRWRETLPQKLGTDFEAVYEKTDGLYADEYADTEGDTAEEDPRNEWYKGYADGIKAAEEEQRAYEEEMFEVPVLVESSFERHWEYENGEIVNVTYTETNHFKED